MATIRPVQLEDAQAHLELLAQIESETKFMLFESNERVMDIDRHRAFLEKYLNSKEDLFLVAEVDGKMVGYLSAFFGGRQKGIHRLELSVMAHNERAVGFYKHMGFEIEGTKRHSLIVDGNYVDEFCMAKLL